ncbi:hypothetical protein EMIT0P74_20342 [Pseudomonas sp. IT-P74]
MTAQQALHGQKTSHPDTSRSDLRVQAICHVQRHFNVDISQPNAISMRLHCVPTTCVFAVCFEPVHRCRPGGRDCPPQHPTPEEHR